MYPSKKHPESVLQIQIGKDAKRVILRNLKKTDFEGVAALCREVYPFSKPWTREQLKSHLEVFPEGQLVAVRVSDGKIVGYAASLILIWRKFKPFSDWRMMTGKGFFTTHDPSGKTLYGAEVIVSPEMRGGGVGGLLYRGRQEIVKKFRLKRIRAGARLRGYHRHARKMNAKQYLDLIMKGKLTDPTLTFQMRRGFRPLHLIQGYLEHDPESLGYAALIEWNPAVKNKKT